MAKHHFVPRMLLRNFAVDNEKKYLNIHLLNNDEYLYNMPLYNQAQEYNLYGSDQKLENSFNKIESFAAPCLAKLNTGNVNLSTDDNCYLKLYLAAQLIRTPGYISMNDNCIDEMIKRIPLNDQQWKKYLDAYNIIKNDPYRLYFNNLRDLYSLISDLRIGLLEADNSKISFMIGQNPVILLNPFLKSKKNWIWSTQGLALKGLVMIMPISPRYSFVLYDSLRYVLLNKYPELIINDADVEKLNDFQYCNTKECVYFTNIIDEEHYKYKNSMYRNYRNSNKSDFEIIGSSINEKTGYKTEITKTDVKEFPIEQKFNFIACKANEYISSIISYNDAKRENVDHVNLKRKIKMGRIQSEIP